MAFPKNPKHPYYQLPEKLAILSINELELSVRSYNALRYRTKTVGELVLLSDDKLLKIRDLGRKSLIDVRRALDEFMARHAGEIAGASDSLQPSIDEVRGQSPDARGSGFSSGGWRVPHHPGQHRSGSSKAIDDVLSAPVEVLDLSARSLNVLTKLKVRYVIELLEYPKRDLFSAENIGRKSLNEIESKLFAYLSDRQSPSNDPASEQSLANPSLGTKDFVEQILSRLPERQRNIIADRYGLWDGIAETLQDIGDKLGLTRERIRQIEARGIQRIRGVFGYGAIRNFVRENICRYVENKETGKFGVVNEDEAVEALAIGCTPEEAGLAIEFLQDISFPGGSLFGRSLIEIEPEVYALSQEAANNYKQVLDLIVEELQQRQKPVSGGTLLNEIAPRVSASMSADPLSFVSRILTISSAVAQLPNRTIALSGWTEFGGHGATSVAEAVLRLLARPAHFSEIVQEAAKLYGEAGIPGKGTIHNALNFRRDKFVWVKSGTYGLTAWGLKRPPFLKDRLIELLSEARYPLPFWHLKEKVLEVCNCKDGSVRMTLDLNPKLFRKFEGNQYGLREHYEK